MAIRTDAQREDRVAAWCASQMAPSAAGHMLAIMGHFEALTAADAKLARVLALHLADTFVPAPEPPVSFKEWLTWELGGW